MPKQRQNELIMGGFFHWKLFRRNDVYWADGRTNPTSAGRHSLGTKSRQEALANLRHLDAIKAIELGLADESILNEGNAEQLPLDTGVGLYRAHVRRPAVTGGASEGTWKRYRAVFDKVLPYFKERSLRYWNQVRKSHLESYAAWLDGESYAYRTEFLELTTIKQCIKWLIEEGHLPADCLICLPLAKPTGTDTYCWRPEEVKAILEHCRSNAELKWLANVLTSLACTGMRISELASLRWSDIDLDQNLITLKDETSSRRRRKGRQKRQTKSRRSRSFPIHEDLRAVLTEIEHADDGLVFRGPKRGVLSPDITRRTLIRDVLNPLADDFRSDEDEIGFKDGRLHSFRHYFCSMCANNNVPEQLVMEWLGHQESKMVRHYYHAHDAEAQRQMKRINFTGEAAAE
jgi:integrase